LTLPDFVLIAWKLNDTMPAYIVRRLARRLAEFDVELQGTPIAILGQTFKRESDDLRQSPAVRIAEILQREGAVVSTHDPFLPGPSIEETLHGAKAFVLATNHSAYETLDAAEISSLMSDPRVAIDCWGVLDRPRFADAGIRLATFGIGEEL
jgi:UDP-N-acetyl-D-mannosaminuronate dehydrogenase